MLKTQISKLSLLVLAAYCSTSMAASVSVTSTPGTAGSYYMTSSSGSLAFDPNLISALGLAGVSISNIAPATYAASTISTSINGVTYDSTTNNITGLSTVGGAKFNMPVATTVFGVAVGGPGNISFTNLNINPVTDMVSANVSGTNITAGTYNIFSFAPATGNTSITGAGNYSLQGSNLAFTTEGANLIAQGLSLSATGVSVLTGVKNLGTLTGTFSLAQVPGAPKPPAVPEPATYMLMGLGLVGLSFAVKRKAKAV